MTDCKLCGVSIDETQSSKRDGMYFCGEYHMRVYFKETEPTNDGIGDFR